jgi:hypothetical protein
MSFAQCYSKIVSYSRSYIALQTDGTLWSKGTIKRLLGFGDFPPPTEFTQIGTDDNWTENISLNNVNVFAIKANGTLWVWGSILANGSAGLGTFDELDYITPTQVGNDSNWAKVSAGDGFTIAVKTDGTLWAWGSNAKGSLGIGNADDLYKTNVPIQVGTDTNWSNVFTGFTTLAYAIKTDGTLWSWGNNGIFLGYPNATANNNYRSPKQVGTDTWKTMDMVWNGPMINGIKTDGTLWAWGNSNGEAAMFANGYTAQYVSLFPIQIGTDYDWKDISMYQLNTQALKTDGTRWGWGYNSIGCELGMGTGQTTDVVFPTQLDPDNDWKTISVDFDYGDGDGIKQTNTLYHWGGTPQNGTFPEPTIFSTSNCTLGTNSFESSFISTYPNPAIDYLHIRFNLSINQNAEVSLYNQLGQKLLLFNAEIVNQESTLNLSNLASGIYFLSLKTNGQVYKTKIIKN